MNWNNKDEEAEQYKVRIINWEEKIECLIFL